MSDPGRAGISCPSEHSLTCDSVCSAFGDRCKLITRLAGQATQAPIFEETAAALGFRPFIMEIIPRQKRQHPS